MTDQSLWSIYLYYELIVSFDMANGIIIGLGIMAWASTLDDFLADHLIENTFVLTLDGND